MAEFLVGLVCIMLLVAGMHQVALLSKHGFETTTNTRYAMAWQYVEDPPLQWPLYNFSLPTRSGMDAKNYTADDRTAGGDDSFYQRRNGYLNRVYDDEVEGWLNRGGRISPHIDLKYSGGVYLTTSALDMMYASDHQAVVAVPFMDKVLDQERILIGRDLWMPRWDAIP